MTERYRKDNDMEKVTVGTVITRKVSQDELEKAYLIREAKVVKAEQEIAAKLKDSKDAHEQSGSDPKPAKRTRKAKSKGDTKAE